MTDKADKISTMKKNRLPKGQRTHTRRLKQAARKDGTIYRALKVYPTPEKIAGE